VRALEQVSVITKGKERTSGEGAGEKGGASPLGKATAVRVRARECARVQATYVFIAAHALPADKPQHDLNQRAK
jgi:hypothetical protein